MHFGRGIASSISAGRRHRHRPAGAVPSSCQGCGTHKAALLIALLIRAVLISGARKQFLCRRRLAHGARIGRREGIGLRHFYVDNREVYYLVVFGAVIIPAKGQLYFALDARW